jgi:hypothetical protein
MAGDPKECRRNAARCAELAVAAHTPQLRARFLELSKNWEKLAIQFEDAFAKLTEHEAIWSDVRESLNETRRLFSTLRESVRVRLYLGWAANAGERATAAVDETVRKFHQAIERRWVNLAASTALSERVDLFLQTREFRFRLSSYDLCPDCHQLVPVNAPPTTTAEFEEYTFQCGNCGSNHTRRVRVGFPS